ncbi:hypothetical protein L227DRAFT_543842 [Lentinus tigrinus ALCF2SS1-6]|uniref:LIM zinc-binding domain-containing protein n=1 Tax=Lentinus tigrinus ALCF2SS1-6 TaxID=1328759 RepID=A0A5C2SIG8_9APHY|nr:hypothetical protein L227DRAFT_543842 [Lentinus tigrinus ALCF2SS1-6]
MGFCRRCGDIVVGPRCKCGGTSVAPVVKWNQNDGQQSRDPWSKTYVTRDKSPSKSVQRTFTGQDSDTNASSSGSPVKRFPRPTTQKPISVSIDKRVSEHIASSTSVPRPPSPLKHSTTAPYDDGVLSEGNSEEGILPNLNGGSRLAKVYGSVLQPEETLSTFICALCSSPFPPDATIYPDPTSIRPGLPIDDVGSGTRFLCRPCFTANGGSKGDCPSCGKAVLILKSEGGFVENSGKVWHKRCFCCEGCFKNIGDHPMVDLLGRPSCADCFETCLKRPSGTTPRKNKEPESYEERSNLGGLKRTSKSREGSPALEELEMRLGIKSRESTPATESRGGRFLNHASSPSTIPTSPPSTHSPISKRYSTTLAGEGSPTAGRLAARARANSAASADSPSVREALSRYRSPEPGDGSPVSRRTFNRLRSPDLDGNEGSPISARLTGTGSPRYSSPVARQPTADAVEEMKQRFLRQASPGLPSAPGQPDTSSATTTPTRRERRSRSRPRSSGVMSSSAYDDPSPNSQVYSSPGTQPLRVVRRDNTGGTDYARRNTTGHTESVQCDATGNSSYARRDTTGDISFIRNDLTGGTDYTLRRDRTGDAEVESLLGAFPKVPTGDLIDLSSDTSMSSIASQSTGNGPVSRIPRAIRDLVSPEDGRVGLGISLRKSMSGTSLATDYSSSIPPTPDLALDFSDTTTQSSAPSTPPSLSPPSRRERAEAEKAVAFQHTGSGISPAKSAATTPTPKSRTLPHDISIPAPLPPDSRCARCQLPLFSRKDGGKFVTVPELPSSSGVPPKTYHTSCFRCTVCDRLFEDKDGGRAVFVRGPTGACHVECAPPEKTVVRTYPVQIPRSAPASQPQAHSQSRTATATYHTSSSRYEPPPKTAPPTQQSFVFPQPRFGSSSTCPGCQKSVSPMERGVVPGPQGSRWHGACLVCGGKEAKGRRKEEGKPGCGKKLDSGAKTDKDGGVWCRECLLILPLTRRGSPSPTRSTPLVPSYTGNKNVFGSVAPQHTGTTTLARQFTGLTGGSDPALMRQLTGGGLSPTRQLTSSPTKMYDGPRPGVSRYPRPKSAIGYAARTKSEGGEGRGMFLVRQLTGGKSKEVM